MDFTNIIAKLKGKKYQEIIVDPSDPIDTIPNNNFDPMMEIIKVKDELIEQLKSENMTLKGIIDDLRNRPKEINTQHEPIRRYVPWSDAKKILEDNARKIAQAKKEMKEEVK